MLCKKEGEFRLRSDKARIALQDQEKVTMVGRPRFFKALKGCLAPRKTSHSSSFGDASSFTSSLHRSSLPLSPFFPMLVITSKIAAGVITSAFP